MIVTGQDLADLELIHFSKDPFLLSQRTYSQSEKNLKPMGLWVSVHNEEDNWSRWCIQEDYELDNLSHKTKIKLRDNGKFIWLKTLNDINDFSKQFSKSSWTVSGDLNISGKDVFRAFHHISSSIKWDKVAEDADGIVISPYIWEARLHTDFSWYYPWDCASGCIWNLDAIRVEVK